MHRGRARLTRARPCVPGLNLSDPAAVKMMVVPRARGPCWLCELPRDAATELLVRTLRARITDVHVRACISGIRTAPPRRVREYGLHCGRGWTLDGAPRQAEGERRARAERSSNASRLSTAATGRAQVLEAVSTADQILDANLERLARSPADLASLVRSVEAALARREAQGRPLLL